MWLWPLLVKTQIKWKTVWPGLVRSSQIKNRVWPILETQLINLIWLGQVKLFFWFHLTRPGQSLFLISFDKARSFDMARSISVFDFIWFDQARSNCFQIKSKTEFDLTWSNQIKSLTWPNQVKSNWKQSLTWPGQIKLISCVTQQHGKALAVKLGKSLVLHGVSK